MLYNYSINNMKNTRIVELVIDENSEELAIDAISLVAAPAIEQDFVFFGKEKNNLTFAKVDEEKRMLVSPALIPNKQIFRYYIYDFSTIGKIYETYAFLVVVAFWIYYSSIVFIICAEIAKLYSDRVFSKNVYY